MTQFTKKTEFISVEITIRTNISSDEWVKWFQQQDNYVDVHPDVSHKWLIYFAPTGYKTANLTILNFCKMINDLPESIKKYWDGAEEREFFIGYHVGEEPHCFIEHLERETLKKVIELGASVRMAMYPADYTDNEGLPKDFYEEQD